jgi:hypothetical protein
LTAFASSRQLFDKNIHWLGIESLKGVSGIRQLRQLSASKKPKRWQELANASTSKEPKHWRELAKVGVRQLSPANNRN